MEGKSEREADEVANAARPGGLSSTRLDEYLTGSNIDEEAIRTQKHHDTGDARGARGGEVGSSVKGSPGSFQLGGDPVRCGLLGGENEGYPCYDCPGGRDFEKCEHIRGMK